MKKRKVLIRYLADHVDKIIIVFSYLLLLYFIVVTASTIRVEEKWRERGVWIEYRQIGNEHFTITYTLNTGDNKPSICAPSGDELLAVDGWKSVIDVDNASRNFWDHVYRNVSNGGEIRHNMIWENYQLRQTTILQDNLVTMLYEFMHSGENASNLTLNLWHRYQKFSTVMVDNQTIYDVSQENENAEPEYLITIERSPQLTAENVPYWGLENGLGWVELTCTQENIAASYNWLTVAEITLSYEKPQKETD